MLSPTLEAGLKAYRIGEKLRTLRLRKKLGLVQLGEHTGLSPALLSKLERGQLFPTLPSLLRIALVYGVGLNHFFTEEEEKRVVTIVRARDRISLPESGESKDSAYSFESLDYPAVDRKSSAYYAQFHSVPKNQTHRHEHAGSELIYVIRGKLELFIGKRSHVLQKHDSAYFDSILSHGYRRISRGPCHAIVVTVP